MSALLRKAARDTLWLLVLVLAGIVVEESLYVLAMGHMAGDLLAIWRKIPFLKNILHVLVGVDLGGDVSTTALIAMGYVHPVLTALTWAFVLTTCTRDTVGTIDDGTADLVLTLPVSRRAAYAATTIVWAAGCGLLACAALLGLVLGERLFGMPEPIEAWRLLPPVFNLWALLLAIGSATMLVSACCSRRTSAIAIMLTVLLASFLVNFLEVFVPEVRRIAFLGFLHYYRPVDSVAGGTVPVGHIATLLIWAAVFWTVGLVRYTRRDIPAA